MVPRIASSSSLLLSPPFRSSLFLSPVPTLETVETKETPLSDASALKPWMAWTLLETNYASCNQQRPATGFRPNPTSEATCVFLHVRRITFKTPSRAFDQLVVSSADFRIHRHSGQHHHRRIRPKPPVRTHFVDYYVRKDEAFYINCPPLATSSLLSSLLRRTEHWHPL